MGKIALDFFGYFQITWYAFFILIGVCIGEILFIKEAKRYEISEEYCTNLLFWTLIFGIVGARLYYVAFNWDYYSTNLSEIYKVWHGGLAIHGGIIAGFLFVLYYTKKYDMRTLKITDIACVSLIFAQAIGRWGNFMNQEAYGAETTRMALENMKIIPKFVIDGMNINGVYYQPAFYYESLWCLLGFIILLIVRRVFKYMKTGQITGIYLMWYGIERFFIEAMRTDSLMLNDFKIAQIVSAVGFVIGAILIIVGFTKDRFNDLYDDIEVSDARF